MENEKAELMIENDSKVSLHLLPEEDNDFPSGKVFPYDEPLDGYDSSIGGAEEKRRRGYYGAWSAYVDEESYNGKGDPLKDVLRGFSGLGI